MGAVDPKACARALDSNQGAYLVAQRKALKPISRAYLGAVQAERLAAHELSKQAAEEAKLNRFLILHGCLDMIYGRN